MSPPPASGAVHLLVPAGFDDPGRASGGNRYDREIACGLVDIGWSVVVHEVSHVWPAPDRDIATAVDRELSLVPDRSVLLVDGLVAAAAAAEVVDQSARLRVVVVVHMPGPPGGPPGDVLRSARLVVATSAATAATVEVAHDLPPGSVVVAPPGAPLVPLAVGTESGQRLLCVAAVTETKGHDVLVAALAGLLDRTWRLVCVGDLDRDPAYVAGLRRTLERAGLADRVRLAGPLTGADLDRAYAAADLLVLPSRQESYGLVVTEALARGVPVIGSEVGGVPEALGRAVDGRRPGVLVGSEDPAALRAALAGWLGDPALRAGLRSAARSRRDRLSDWSRPVGLVAAALAGVADLGDRPAGPSDVADLADRAAVAFASVPSMNRSDLPGVPLT